MNGRKGTLRVWAGVLAVLAVCAQLCLAQAAEAASVTLNWTFNYTVDTACTTAVTKNCVSGFEYGTTPDGGTTLTKLGTVANPTTPSATGATAVATSFTQGAPYGAVVYYARTIGLDGSGNTIYSSPAIASAVQIVPAPPSSLTVTVH